jgi:hypothetical protein
VPSFQHHKKLCSRCSMCVCVCVCVYAEIAQMTYSLCHSAMAYTAKWQWFDSRKMQGTFLFSKEFTPALCPIQTSLHWVLRIFTWSYSGRIVKLTHHFI